MTLVGDNILKTCLEGAPEKTTFILPALFLFITELDTWITGLKLKWSFKVLEKDNHHF